MFMFEGFQEMYKLIRQAQSDPACLQSEHALKILRQAEQVLRKHGKDPDALPDNPDLMKLFNSM